MTPACTKYCYKFLYFRSCPIILISVLGRSIQLGSFLKFLDENQLQRRVNEILEPLISLNKSLATIESFSSSIMPKRNFFLQYYKLLPCGRLLSHNRECQVSNPILSFLRHQIHRELLSAQHEAQYFQLFVRVQTTCKSWPCS